MPRRGVGRDEINRLDLIVKGSFGLAIFSLILTPLAVIFPPAIIPITLTAIIFSSTGLASLAVQKYKGKIVKNQERHERNLDVEGIELQLIKDTAKPESTSMPGSELKEISSPKEPASRERKWEVRSTQHRFVLFSDVADRETDTFSPDIPSKRELKN